MVPWLSWAGICVRARKLTWKSGRAKTRRRRAWLLLARSAAASFPAERVSESDWILDARTLNRVEHASEQSRKLIPTISSASSDKWEAGHTTSHHHYSSIRGVDTVRRGFVQESDKRLRHSTPRPRRSSTEATPWPRPRTLVVAFPSPAASSSPRRTSPVPMVAATCTDAAAPRRDRPRR
jgi:hypothetical protein